MSSFSSLLILWSDVMKNFRVKNFSHVNSIMNCKEAFFPRLGQNKVPFFELHSDQVDPRFRAGSGSEKLGLGPVLMPACHLQLIPC